MSDASTGGGVGGGPQSAAAACAPHSAERTLQVLVVDDSPIVCERMVLLINDLDLNIHVATAGDSSRALQILEADHPDVAVLDIALPGMDGFDLLAQIKARQPSCVVVMLTTYAYPEFRATAARLGATHFFNKVMEFEQVADVLKFMANARGAPALP